MNSRFEVLVQKTVADESVKICVLLQGLPVSIYTEAGIDVHLEWSLEKDFVFWQQAVADRLHKM